MRLTREEIGRKLLHLFALLMPIGIFYLPKWSFPDYTMTVILTFILSALVLIEYLRSRSPIIQKIFISLFGTMLRKEELTNITGATWAIGAALLCSILFINHTHISFMALSLFTIGDAVAALVGISIGRIKIGGKSLEGSLACFLLCLILFYAVFPYVPGLMDVWGGKTPILIIWTTSFVITVCEMIPLKITPRYVINDNLAVPIIAGYVILGLEKILL